MKIITHEEISALHLSPETIYTWASNMIEQKSRAVLKPKISLKFDKTGFYNVMPALLPDEDVAGVKVVSRYARRSPSLDSQLLLYSLSSGELLALMDANYITAMRTGAVAAYSILHLAVEGFTNIGMIGLGNTARAAFLILLALMPQRRLQVKLKAYKTQHTEFIEAFSSCRQQVEFVVCDTYEEVVSGSEVLLSSVTYAEGDFCEDSCYQPGVLVVPIHTRGFQNCDLFFDKVFADDAEHIRPFQYFDRFRFFAELSDVAAGRVNGRSSPTERILAYNIGIAIHDVYFAKKIYELLPPQSLCGGGGNLNQIQNKFWLP